MQFSDFNPNPYGENPYIYAGSSGKPYMGQERQRGRNAGWIIGCLSVLLALILLGAVIGFILNISVVWGATVIQVGDHPTLIVESEGVNQSVINPSAIHIHAGEANGRISIQTNRPLNIPFGLPETYQESSDHQTVTYDVDSAASGIYDITVPAQTNLKVDTNGFALQVHGVSGQMVLTTNSGTLTLTNCHVLGPSLLRSNSGQISANQDQLSGAVAIDNNSASITFQGSLDPAGKYRFTNNQGPMTLTLPRNTATHIDATTTSGMLISNFPGTHVGTRYGGFDLHVDIGATPRALLSLYNNGGSITLNEQEGR